MIRTKKKSMIKLGLALESPLSWPLPDNVKSVFSGRQGGVSLPPYDSFNLGDHVGDDDHAVTQNRALLLDALNGAESIQWLSQVHGNCVVEAGDGSQVLTADAVTTIKAGVVCAVLTADCLPVLFCDNEGKRVAAAHAGWRGLADGILLNTLKCFDDPSKGPEVRDAFAWAGDDCFTAGQGDRLYADIFKLARLQLESAGIGAVYGGGVCTASAPEQYFSFRRDGVTGRQVSVIWKTC
jgi:copper oxidase (laccase) domain-containing protein